VPLKLYATLNDTHEDVERDGGWNLNNLTGRVTAYYCRILMHNFDVAQLFLILTARSESIFITSVAPSNQPYTFPLPSYSIPSYPITLIGEALDSYNSPRPLTLSVVDFTGLCMMTIPSRWVDLDHPIVTKITLRDYSSAVLSIHLLLIRTEYIHDVRAVLCLLYCVMSCYHQTMWH
jgi:hypothetical protein